MKQQVFRRCLIIVLLLILPLFMKGCSNDFELQDENSWKKLCTQWGTPSAKIRSMMKTYTQLSSLSGVLVYKGKGDTDAISYKFVSDSLCAAMVMMKSETTNIAALRKTFSHYEYLGEYNSNDLFIGEDQLVTIKQYSKDDISYIAVGYVPFKLE